MKLRRLILAVPVFAVLAAGGLTLDLRQPSVAEALTNCSVSDFSTDAEEQAFLTQINQYRSQNGLVTLSISTGLSRMATWHATDMVSNGYFSHTDSLGRSFATRLSQCDAAGGTAAENIAAGHSSAQAVFGGWQSSSGHNTNMLNSSVRYIGIARVSGGQYGTYWVTVLSSANPSASGGGGGTQATATPTQPPPTATPTRTATAAAVQPSPTPTRTPTPVPTQAPVQVPAEITSPQQDSTLPGSTASVEWSAGSGAEEYYLYLGTSEGANNIYGASAGLSRSRTFSGLPTDSSTIYVRIWTRFGTNWQYRDSSFQAAAPVASSQAVLTSPTPGSRLSGSRVTFSWAPGQNATEYFFYVGTSKGANNLYGRSAGLATSATVSSLPTNGSTIHVRLWTRSGSTRQFTDYTYRAR